MAIGTKYNTKQELLDAIQELVYENDDNLTTSDNIQKAAKDIVESLWEVPIEETISIFSPFTGNKTLFRTNSAITIASIYAAILGTGGAQITFNIAYGTQRDTLTTTLYSINTTTANSGGTSIPPDQNLNIPAGNWICLTIISTSGTPTEFVLNINYYLQ